MRIKTPARPAVAAAAIAVAVIAFSGAVGADDQSSAEAAMTAMAGDVAPHGVWLDAQGRGAIEIAPCATGLCGRLVWTKDTSTSARSACGMQIIGDVKRIDSATWNGGWIYSPELKSRFDVEIKPIDAGKLEVTGFAGTRDLSETMIWRRAPADLARCNELGRAGYVAAKVGAKPAKVAALVGTAAGAGSAVIVTVAEGAKQKRAKSAEKSPAKPAKAAAKSERKTASRVAETPRERSHQHSSGCHVRAPFVSVSFRCSSKASRVLARIF